MNSGSEGVFGSARAVFEIIGELVDRRLVTSPKQPDWKLHVWKVASRGSTLEVEVPSAEYDRGVTDAPYSIVGKITMDGGRTKLIAQTINRADQGPATRSRPVA